MSNAVKSEVVKKTVYDKLVGKVNNIDTSGFVLESKYQKDITELENKIPDTNKLLQKSDYKSKVSEIMYSLIIKVTVRMVYLLSSFNFVEKSNLNQSTVKGCSIPN